MKGLRYHIQSNHVTKKQSWWEFFRQCFIVYVSARIRYWPSQYHVDVRTRRPVNLLIENSYQFSAGGIERYFSCTRIRNCVVNGYLLTVRCLTMRRIRVGFVFSRRINFDDFFFVFSKWKINVFVNVVVVNVYARRLRNSVYFRVTIQRTNQNKNN